VKADIAGDEESVSDDCTTACRVLRAFLLLAATAWWKARRQKPARRFSSSLTSEPRGRRCGTVDAWRNGAAAWEGPRSSSGSDCRPADPARPAFTSHRSRASPGGSSARTDSSSEAATRFESRVGHATAVRDASHWARRPRPAWTPATHPEGTLAPGDGGDFPGARPPAARRRAASSAASARAYSRLT
jgi:hypothetical protein